MARFESVAIGGYFPTPDKVVGLIRDCLVFGGEYGLTYVVDPCAGDGAAIEALTENAERCQIFTCEMEATRHEALAQRMRGHSGTALHGDAFSIPLEDHEDSGAGLLFLNPPYDFDPVHGRLEQRFLQRFTAVLTYGGWLVFVVPHYALEASAQYLASEYRDLQCFRFPEGEFEVFKQVVLFARRRKADDFGADPRVITEVESWAADASHLTSLGDDPFAVEIPKGGYVSQWKIQGFDFTGLLTKARPWSMTSRTGALVSVPHVLPEVPVEDLLFRVFPVATAPRPAHTAAGIASGLFNGQVVKSHTPGKPDLLVKGTFDREFVTVEEKTNRDGEVTSVVQVQQPRLVTTVLNLETKRYTTLGPGSGLTIEMLLEDYGPSLLGVMRKQCPVSYDSKRDSESFPLAPVTRQLYTAQEHAAKALLSLLGGSKASRQSRRYRGAILLGEIGSGKSSVALTVGATISRRMLVMCPPHLLDSWKAETLAVLPSADFRVLEDLSDIDSLATDSSDRPVVAVLSRETAKLGHGWTDVRQACPKCGASLPKGPLAKKRIRCEATSLVAKNHMAKLVQQLALKLSWHSPNHYIVRTALKGRFLGQLLKTYEDHDYVWEGLDAQWVIRAVKGVLKSSNPNPVVLGHLLLSAYDESLIAFAVRGLLAKQDNYYNKDAARNLLWLLPHDSALFEELEPLTRGGWGQGLLMRGPEEGHRTTYGQIQWKAGKVTLNDMEEGSLELAIALLRAMAELAHFEHGEPCGELLFQAIPEPRRYPLAKYIARRYPNLFDFLVLDEGHEYQNGDTAQSHAAHRLTALGIPTLLMTGSIMNGYAASLFTNIWALSPAFRDEFAKDDRQRFIDRYGYRKRILTDKDRESGEVIEFGSHTDRVERSERMAGDAPGILPLFLFRHLLGISVTLHKADLALELPPCRQIKCEVDPGPELLDGYQKLQGDLLRAIRKDKFDPERAGKLFGALAEFPSYLDRATDDTGNRDDGQFQICYPESVGGDIVSTGKTFESSTLLPKESWMLDTLLAELEERRNVMVFCWHINLLPRLAKLIKEELGFEAPILYADKVPTAKRQAWIDKNIVSKKRRVMIANPVAIQTGLNNLVHFSTQIWMENPAVNPILFRQGVGRVDRIGKTQESRIYTPVYKGTLQEQLHDLLLRKVAVSVSTDGLDPESVLLASGALDDGYLTGLSVGKQLWAMLEQQA